MVLSSRHAVKIMSENTQNSCSAETIDELAWILAYKAWTKGGKSSDVPEQSELEERSFNGSTSKIKRVRSWNLAYRAWIRSEEKILLGTKSSPTLDQESVEETVKKLKGSPTRIIKRGLLNNEYLMLLALTNKYFPNNKSAKPFPSTQMECSTKPTVTPLVSYQKFLPDDFAERLHQVLQARTEQTQPVPEENDEQVIQNEIDQLAEVMVKYIAQRFNNIQSDLETLLTSMGMVQCMESHGLIEREECDTRNEMMEICAKILSWMHELNDRSASALSADPANQHPAQEPNIQCEGGDGSTVTPENVSSGKSEQPDQNDQQSTENTSCGCANVNNSDLAREKLCDCRLVEPSQPAVNPQQSSGSEETHCNCTDDVPTDDQCNCAGGTEGEPNDKGAQNNPTSRNQQSTSAGASQYNSDNLGNQPEQRRASNPPNQSNDNPGPPPNMPANRSQYSNYDPSIAVAEDKTDQISIKLAVTMPNNPKNEYQITDGIDGRQSYHSSIAKPSYHSTISKHSRHSIATQRSVRSQRNGNNIDISLAVTVPKSNSREGRPNNATTIEERVQKVHELQLNTPPKVIDPSTVNLMRNRSASSNSSSSSGSVETVDMVPELKKHGRRDPFESPRSILSRRSTTTSNGDHHVGVTLAVDVQKTPPNEMDQRSMMSYGGGGGGGGSGGSGVVGKRNGGADTKIDIDIKVIQNRTEPDMCAHCTRDVATTCSCLITESDRSCGCSTECMGDVEVAVETDHMNNTREVSVCRTPETREVGCNCDEPCDEPCGNPDTKDVSCDCDSLLKDSSKTQTQTKAKPRAVVKPSRGAFGGTSPDRFKNTFLMDPHIGRYELKYDYCDYANRQANSSARGNPCFCTNNSMQTCNTYRGCYVRRRCGTYFW